MKLGLGVSKLMITHVSQGPEGQPGPEGDTGVPGMKGEKVGVRWDCSGPQGLSTRPCFSALVLSAGRIHQGAPSVQSRINVKGAVTSSE